MPAQPNALEKWMLRGFNPNLSENPFIHETGRRVFVDGMVLLPPQYRIEETLSTGRTRRF
jgi:hypothetical protein